MGKAEKILKLAEEQLNGEEVKYWVFGMFKSRMLGNGTVRNGIFVATERQVFFYCKRFTGFESESFPFSNISSVEIGKGMMGHKISVIVSGNKAEMTGINLGQVDEFVEYINSKIGKKTENASTPSTTDAAEEIRKFKALLDEGILTQEEFDAKKKQILGL